ncbi:glycosyltransferase family 4 protein [Caulobacter sp. 17J80-11]|uniref:glycosyltransferase family 4 protein n=1 Tax=Caulobacter sp. 17J80-11 TaxID=2763502 RepID=UPI001653BF88|nr:glycosyltransferase family 4 protein [Caulobacter sp. 17J80-11]
MARPTRILIAVSALGGGGAERSAAALANTWAGQGREVRVVTLWPALDHDYPLAEGVSRVALDLAHIGGKPIQSLVGNFRALAAWRREIKRFHPDVVLGMITETNVMVALASVGLGCRVVGSERSSPANSRLSRTWGVLRRWTYGLLDGAVAQTEGAADWLRANTFARGVRVIPNAITLPVPDSSPRLDPAAVHPAGPILLGVGRLATVKRFELLIDAFARVAAAHPDWTLVLLGEGPERDRLEGLAADHGLQERVLLPGRAGNMSAWYERASLLALTSWHEGFPNVLLEAMAHGVPVVSVDCPDGPRAIVRDEVDGVLVDPPGADELGRALDGLMGDDARRGRMSDAAREVLDRFSEPAVMRQWNEALGLGEAP